MKYENSLKTAEATRPEKVSTVDLCSLSGLKLMPSG